MEAELVHGVAVLNVLEPPASLARESQRQGRDALMAYWGYSFEEACTGGVYDEPIDCLDAFCSVVRTGVGRHRLIMGGEVDCWDGERAGLAGYVELKTTRVMDNPSQVARFERDKLLKWWAQSFPIGVRRIVVGFRDDAGFVRKLQTLETLKLPGYAARHPRAWDPKTALRFADRLLTWLRKHLEQLPEGTRVRLEYEPAGSGGGGGRTVRGAPNEVRLRVCDDGEVPDFVPVEAREALRRAAALRAASAASSGGRGSSLRSRDGSDRANSGGSVGGARREGGAIHSGPAEVASRRSALKRPSPASSKDEEMGRVGGRGGSFTGAGAGAAESAKAAESSGNRAEFDVSVPGANPAPSSDAPPGTADDPDHHGRDAHHASQHRHRSRQEQPPTTRVAVHWAGADPPAPHHNHRRRRRQERSQTPVPGARSLQHLYRFYQPIVAGPGFGDPLKMAADKQAYARSLGASAMSYLMGFVPGDQGWIGGGDDDDDDGDDKDDDGPGDGIDGGVDAEKRGGIDGSSTKDRGYGLDPKAYAFDPMNPAASAKAAAAMTVAGSEGDGQQSSFVAAGSGEEIGEDDGQEGGGGSGGAGSVGGRSTDSRSDASRRRSGGGGSGGGAGGGGGEQREVGSTPRGATSANEGGSVGGGGGVEGHADEEEGGGSGTKKPRSG